MERLLKDAEKISGQKYDISNLNDVYEAIHVMQGELGISGTTAEEAASTLSGSFASMKAAADNFLGNLALGRNIGPAMKGLADSAATFLFQNLLPTVGNIMKSLPSAMVSFIKTGLPLLKQAGMDMINNLTSGADASQFGEKLGNIILKNAPKVLKAVGSLLLTLIEYLLKGAGQLIKVGASLVTALVTGLGSAALQKAKGAATKVVNAITSPFRKVGSFIRGIVKSVSSILSFSGLSSKVRSVFNRVRDSIKVPIDKAKSVVSDAIKKIKGYFPFNIGKILNLKIPHINVSGGKAPWGIGGKGTKPSFNVTWAAKGMILDDATIIGAGEAGREGIIPLEGRYMRPFAKTIAQEMPNGSGTTNNVFNITVDGAEDPEQFASRLVSRLKIEMRTA